MSEALSRVAQRVGCSERTLRRCVSEGLLRGRRLAGPGVELSARERGYVESHWQLLSGLRAALRTERAVALAVLYGSSAVGDDESDSDVDLLLVHRNSTAHAVAGVQLRLSRALRRRVHAVSIEQAETMPTLLRDVLDEGRVLIDREGMWQRLCARRDEVAVAARREEHALLAGASAAARDARERVSSAA